MSVAHPLSTLAADLGAASHDMLATIVTAIAGGVFLLVIARRVHVPAIVLLLAGGVALGPYGLDLARPDSLGEGLIVLVEMAVGLILFEGGLTLRLDGYRSAPAMIKRLLTVGVLVTWLASTVVLRFLIPLPWNQAVIAASLIIVTGPTVIAPLLKRVRVTPRLHAILNWEAVLIDPIGVFVAVLCFEWLIAQGGTGALMNLGARAGAGLVIGILGGLFILVPVRRRIVPPDLTNIFALASAVLVFGVSEAVIAKAGLLSVAVAGFIFGLGMPAGLKHVRRFKAELTDLLIATLFVLLAARLHLDQFAEFGWRGVAAVLAVMFLIRPLCIALSSLGLSLSLPEKAFLSWVAPRGIVAASMASLFAISLDARGAEQARFVETFTYSVIVATIVVQGLTAGPMARLLKVRRPDPTGWLIVGAHPFGRRLAAFVQSVAGRTAVLVDSSTAAVQEARSAGLHAIRDDALDVELLDRHELTDIGHVLALTDNEDLNARVCEVWTEVVGDRGVFRCHAGRPAGGAGASGRLVWPILPRPSAVSVELAQGTSVAIEIGDDERPPEGSIPLASFDGRRVRLDPRLPESRPGVRGLYLRRETDQLVRSVRPGLVLIREEPCPLVELVHALVDRLVDVSPGLPRDATIREIMEREAAFPSIIGDGVAMPHAHSEHVLSPLCAIARVSGGVEFPAEAASPVCLVFLIVSPARDPKAHLALLAYVARLLTNDETRQALMDAETADEMVEIIRQRSGAGR